MLTEHSAASALIAVSGTKVKTFEATISWWAKAEVSRRHRLETDEPDGTTREQHIW